MTHPSMDDLRRAGIEATVAPIQRDIDKAVAALPWPGRLIYRAVLPIARIIYRLKGKR